MNRLLRVFLAATLVGSFFTILPVATSEKAEAAGGGKVTICHRTRSVTNPYRMITVSQSAATKNAGHKGHNGGVFNTTAGYYTTGGNAKDWGDILPGTDAMGDLYNGGSFNKNWDASGKAFFPGGANASLCSKMTAKQFYDIQIAAGITASLIIDDLNDQEANEDIATLAALPGGVFSTSNITTAETVVSATTVAASSITVSGATLNGSIKAGSVGMKWQFEWGPSSTLETATTTTTTLSSGTITSTTQSVNQAITGLTSGATYYFRVLGVTNAGTDTEGIYYGSILSFTASAPITQAIDFGTLSNKTYGDADFTISSRSEITNTSGNATGLTVTYTSQTSSKCTVGSSTLGGSDSSSATVTIVAVGTCTIRASQAGGMSGGSNYSAASNVDRSFTITAAPVSITADNKSKTVGDTDPSFTSTVTGTLFNGDVVTVSSVTYTRITGETVGTYAITPAAGTLSSSNYTITSYIDGTLTITAVVVNNSGGGGGGNSQKSPQKAAPIKNTVFAKTNPATPAEPANPNTPNITQEPKNTKSADALPTATVPIVDLESNPIILQEAEIKKGPVKETVDKDGKLSLIVPIGFKGTVEVEITPKSENPGGTSEKQIILIPVEGPKLENEPQENLINRPRIIPPVEGKIKVLGLENEVNVSWKPDPKAQAYEVYSNNELVCTTVFASCSIPAENGVRKPYEVVTITNTGIASVGKATGAALAKGTLLAIVYFATDKDVLTPKSKATLNKLSNDLLALGLRDVSLTGHTDTQAPGEYNQALSNRRSNKVDSYLATKVVNAVVNKAFSGEEELAVRTADEVAAAKNRRVEIRVR